MCLQAATAANCSVSSLLFVGLYGTMLLMLLWVSYMEAHAFSQMTA
jgi:hypothetical protein